MNKKSIREKMAALKEMQPQEDSFQNERLDADFIEKSSKLLKDAENKSIADRIREDRLNREMSQCEYARFLGYKGDRSIVLRAERGVFTEKFLHLWRLTVDMR